MRWSLLLLCAVALTAAELPPSPSTAPGIRIWPPPAFTHWPAIAYPDETRNAAVGIPVKEPGAKAELGWEKTAMLAVTLPTDADRTSGLVDLSLAPGQRRLRVGLPGGETLLPIRVVPAGEPWPLARLLDGYPVDAAGTPVVLLDTRRLAGGERAWKLLREDLPRPTGRALIVGDPLEAMGTTAWAGLDAEPRPATDLAKPHHACLVALARLPDPLPRTLIWCPGNGAVRYGDADPEEVRFLGVVRTRLAALGAMPLLILALPPRPVEARLQRIHDRRREALLGEADRIGWKVLDLARVAGDPQEANRVGDGVFTTYPTGEALGRVREALATALAR